MASEQIVGRWASDAIKYNFYSDGSCEYFNMASGKGWSGGYNVKSNKMIFTVQGRNIECDLSLQGDRLTLVVQGHSETFRRVN